MTYDKESSNTDFEQIEKDLLDMTIVIDGEEKKIKAILEVD